MLKWLERSDPFPPVETALREPNGLLCAGADLSVERLFAAYRRGIFPWYNPGQPILWWSPDPRAVLYPEKLKISRSLRQTLKRGQLRVTFDTCFREVMLACAAPRAQYPVGGTWINDAMVEAYARLMYTTYEAEQQLAATPILVVSSLYTAVPGFRVSPQAGWLRHDGFLAKPVDLDELLRSVGERLARRTPVAAGGGEELPR